MKKEKDENKKMKNEEARQRHVENLLNEKLSRIPEPKSLLGLSQGYSTTMIDLSGDKDSDDFELISSRSSENLHNARKNRKRARNTTNNAYYACTNCDFRTERQGALTSHQMYFCKNKDGKGSNRSHISRSRSRSRKGEMLEAKLKITCNSNSNLSVSEMSSMITEDSSVRTNDGGDDVGERLIHYCIRGGTSFMSDGNLISKRSIAASVRKRRVETDLNTNYINKTYENNFKGLGRKPSEEELLEQSDIFGEKMKRQSSDMNVSSSSSTSSTPSTSSSNTFVSPFIIDDSQNAVEQREMNASIIFNGRLKSKWLIKDLKRLRLVDKNGNERPWTKKDRLDAITRPLRSPMEIASMEPEIFQKWVEGPSHLDAIKRAIASSNENGYNHINDVIIDLNTMLSNNQELIQKNKDSLMLRDKLKAMKHYVNAVKIAKPLTLSDVEKGIATNVNGRIHSSKRKRK